MQSDSEYLRSVALGYRLSQALYVFAELKIADILDDAPAGSADIAERAGAHEEYLIRILRVGRAMGLVDEPRPSWFSLTDRGRLLRKGVDGSLWPRVRSVGDDWQWTSWGRLLQTVVTGKSAFEANFDGNSFDYFEQNPDAGETMMNRVTVEAKQRGAAIADIIDFAAVRSLVDVGGGRGAVLAEVVSRHPHLRGTLLDLPYAVAGAPALFAGFSVADRCEIVAGDFRRELPSGGDVYLLSAVLHSWTDDESVELLRRCLAAAERVIVLDEVIEPAEASMDTHLKDLQLMVFSGGRQRGLEEYRRVFDRAGADLVRSTPVGKQEMLMEGRRRPPNTSAPTAR